MPTKFLPELLKLTSCRRILVHQTTNAKDSTVSPISGRVVAHALG